MQQSRAIINPPYEWGAAEVQKIIYIVQTRARKTFNGGMETEWQKD